jgi:hypothetical protein
VTGPITPASTPIDGQTAFAGGPKTPPVAPNPAPIPVGGSGSIVLCGWQATDTAVPAGATITGVQLTIAHYELPCATGNQQDSNGQSGDGTCKPGPSFSDPGETQDPVVGQPDCDGDDPCINGTIRATVSVGNASCDTPNMVSRLVLGQDLVGCNGGLLGTTADGQFMQNLRINYHVDVTALPVTQAFLDGIVMTISYNTPPIQAGTGCVVALSCPAFSTLNVPQAGGANSAIVANWGTAYFPAALATLSFSANSSNTNRIAFDRGLIASQVNITQPPAASSAGLGQFRLGTGSGRTFVLTSTAGNAKVTARIRIVDSANASPHGFAVAVREWSTAQ